MSLADRIDVLMSRVLAGDIEMTPEEAKLLRALLKSRKWSLAEMAAGLPNPLEVALELHEATTETGRQLVAAGTGPTADEVPSGKVEAYIELALIRTHGYENGEVRTYDAAIASSGIAEQLVRDQGMKLGTAKAAVSRALAAMFPADGKTRPGLETYQAYRRAKTPLLRWFVLRHGVEQAYGTVGDLSDLAERELHNRVAGNS